AGGVGDVLNRCGGFPQVAEVDSHPAASLGELQGGVNRPPDGLHIVLHAQQEAGHALPALRPTGVQKSGGGGLEVAANDRKSTRLNSSHVSISYAVFCLQKKK